MTVTADIQEIKTAKTAYPIHPILAKRWSPRMFSKTVPDRETIHALLEAARWAASSNNAQPWRFIYAYRGSLEYEKIFNCLSDFNKKWVRNAPVLVVTAYKENFSSGKVNFHALHDLGLAVAQMTIQAHSMGIGLHQMAGVDWQKAQEVFNVPEGYHIATCIAIGYYGGNPADLPADLEKLETQARKRLPQEDFAWEGKWNMPE